MIMKYPTHSDMLSSKPQLGWVIGKDWEIAAVPVANSKKYVVVYDNCKMKTCRNKQSAENFISKLKKRKSK